MAGNASLPVSLMSDKHRYLSLQGAMQVVREHAIASAAEYRKLARVFSRSGWRLPEDPRRHYGDQFVSWERFLHDEQQRAKIRDFVPYGAAKAVVQRLHLPSRTAYLQARREGQLPENLPAAPNVYYGHQWEGWTTFLGKAPRRAVKPGEALSFEAARSQVHARGFRTRVDWQRWTMSPDFPARMPRSPNIVYRDRGWLGWPDFLGADSAQGRRRLLEEGRSATGSSHLPRTAAYSSARTYVRTLHLNSIRDFRRWADSGMRPEHIPASPEHVYRGQGWTTWADFLGLRDYAADKPRRGRTRNRPFLSSYLPFHLARKTVREMNLPSAQTYLERLTNGTLGARLPPRPDLEYADHGWVSWADFLGRSSVSRLNLALVDGKYLPFVRARRYVRRLGLDTPVRWASYAGSDERPEFIPAEPWKVYVRDGFVSLQDFLGVG
jgi:hypothetical protein